MIGCSHADFLPTVPVGIGSPWVQSFRRQDVAFGGNSWPKISIVTPSYNQAEFLEQTILSVVGQGYPNLEYIIIDGGSTDGSIEIIKKYQHYVSFWCSEADGGQYDGINKGFDRSSGEIMAWLNSDDLYFPWTLWMIADIMTGLPNIQWLTTRTQAAVDWLGFLTHILSIEGFSKESFLDGKHLPLMSAKPVGWVQQESTVWRRPLWESVGARIAPEFRLAGDFYLWAQFFSRSPVYTVRAPLAAFRFHPRQKSLDTGAYLAEAKGVLEECRRSWSWRRSPIRDFIYCLRLNRLPLVQMYAKNFFGYLGQDVVRSGPGTLQTWQDRSYKFL